jgi:hypothetical protein
MSDAVANITLQAGDSFDTLVGLPSAQAVDGYYLFDLSSLTSAESPYKYFKLTAEDNSGNTVEYRFVVEVGVSLDPEDIADETLLVCIESDPTITFNPGTPSGYPGRKLYSF